MFALDYWVGPCGTTYGMDAIACQLYYNTEFLKKNLKKKEKQPPSRRRKKARTESQTKDHTRKCKIRCSREEHEREDLS
jgi:hypothetical protein